MWSCSRSQAHVHCTPTTSTHKHMSAWRQTAGSVGFGSVFERERKSMLTAIWNGFCTHTCTHIHTQLHNDFHKWYRGGDGLVGNKPLRLCAGSTQQMFSEGSSQSRNHTADTLIGTRHGDIHLRIRSPEWKFSQLTYQSLKQIMVYKTSKRHHDESEKWGLRKRNRWSLAEKWQTGSTQLFLWVIKLP